MNEQQRIEKEAEAYATTKEITLSTAYFCRYRGYIAGANATRLRYIEEIMNLKEAIAWRDQQIKDLRESLKDNSPF